MTKDPAVQGLGPVYSELLRVKGEDPGGSVASVFDEVARSRRGR